MQNNLDLLAAPTQWEESKKSFASQAHEAQQSFVVSTHLKKKRRCLYC